MASQRQPGGAHPSRVRSLVQVVLGLLGLLLLCYLAVVSYRFAQIQLGPFAPLAAILFLALLLAIIGPLLLVRYHRTLWGGLARGAQRLGALLAATGLPQRFAHRFPRFSRFLVARLTPGSPVGLALTAWVVVGLLALEQVIELSIEVSYGTGVPALDRRIENLVAIIRTPELDQLFYAVTWLGSIRVVAALAMAGLLLALLARRWREALLLPLVAALSWLSTEGLKNVIARPRPPLADARVLETGFSFPSTHATVSAAFYGVAAYFLIRGLRRDSAKIHGRHTGRGARPHGGRLASLPGRALSERCAGGVDVRPPLVRPHRDRRSSLAGAARLGRRTRARRWTSAVSALRWQRSHRATRPRLYRRLCGCHGWHAAVATTAAAHPTSGHRLQTPCHPRSSTSCPTSPKVSPASAKNRSA